MGPGLQEEVREESGKPNSINEDRADLQEGTRYHLSEARRSIGYAYFHFLSKNRIQYIEWMNNAIELLLEANNCRMKALSISWRK